MRVQLQVHWKAQREGSEARALSRGRQILHAGEISKRQARMKKRPLAFQTVSPRYEFTAS